MVILPAKGGEHQDAQLHKEIYVGVGPSPHIVLQLFQQLWKSLFLQGFVHRDPSRSDCAVLKFGNDSVLFPRGALTDLRA